MRKTQAETQLTHKRLLEAAYELIHEKGYDRVTRTEIAERVGMTRGVVNWHFSSKEEIYLEVLMDVLQKTGDMRAAIQNDRSLTPQQQLTELFLASSKYSEWFLFVNSVPEYLQHLPAFTVYVEKIQQNRLDFIAYLQQCVELIDEERGHTLTRDKKTICDILYFLYEGISLYSRTNAISHLIPDIDIETYISYILQ